MAINLKRLKKNIDSRAGDGFFKARDGKNVIRLLPPKDPDAELPWVANVVHFNLPGDSDNSGVICGRTYGEPGDYKTASGECPICSHVKELYNSNDPEDKELASKYRAQVQYFAYILDKTEKSAKEATPIPYRFGKSVKQGFEDAFVLDTSSDEDDENENEEDQVQEKDSEQLLDITDMKTGYWLNLNKKQKGKESTFIEYSVQRRANPSKLPGVTVKRVKASLEDLSKFVVPIDEKKIAKCYKELVADITSDIDDVEHVDDDDDDNIIDVSPPADSVYNDEEDLEDFEDME